MNGESDHLSPAIFVLTLSQKYSHFHHYQIIIQVPPSQEEEEVQ